MLYIHKDTGEIVEVVGIFTRPNGTRMAYCLCDARLHFGKGREVAVGTVAADYPMEVMTPLNPPDWDAVKEQYPDGTWDAVLENKKRNLETSLRAPSMAVYKKTYEELRDNGVPQDLSLEKAEDARRNFLEERLNKKPAPYSGRTPFKW